MNTPSKLFFVLAAALGLIYFLPGCRNHARIRLEENSARAEAIIGRGDAQRASGRAKAAKKCYLQGRELAAGDAALLVRLAEGFLALGEEDEAYSAADQAVGLGGATLPYALEARGRAALGRGDRAQAERDFAAALLQAPAADAAFADRVQKRIQELPEGR